LVGARIPWPQAVFLNAFLTRWEGTDIEKAGWGHISDGEMGLHALFRDKRANGQGRSKNLSENSRMANPHWPAIRELLRLSNVGFLSALIWWDCHPGLKK
jgi:hypothetical protein